MLSPTSNDFHQHQVTNITTATVNPICEIEKTEKNLKVQVCFFKFSGTANTPMKRYDLMHEINGRGTFMVSQICLPYLLQSKTKHGRVPHILNNAPVRIIILFCLILFNLVFS